MGPELLPYRPALTRTADMNLPDPPAGPPMQLLLVEDDRPLALSLRKALTSQGFAVNHVETGQAALHVVDIEHPDMVILDIGLPDISGLAVLKKLRGKQIGRAHV